ncbi:hypothetical protein [Sulfurisphaera ohwakuensis]|uniref:Sterol desaturase/sphingolipid hydroxylase (Fatty acid hydroxylase superfamily) n=1 Tax=Sulfurisphaera ohwakuensis TaxID=69656 RepID=A0A650CFD1_SULOH|nr:hypothetical protein [Sulfurisphaera ohwakuensis]MBB5255094.1 sterol desaturase/sphingolipid hydroxylase (fatty acid hydroxylase superfamily) [Sulfurisphaera ohwakuensis]QGR16482.1 hypothetical protein D1869_04155 [Sulfurisphaera ohwakuensis]
MANEVPLTSFIENIESELIERIRNILELIIILSSVAYLGVYLISTLDLSPYFYFTPFIFYFIVGYEIRKLMKLHKSYLKLLRLREKRKLDEMRRRFVLVNNLILIFNIILALIVFYKLPYLIPLMMSLILYLYHGIDKRIISREKVLIVTLINVLFSIIMVYDPSDFYVLTSMTNLIDLVVMKVDIGR